MIDLDVHLVAIQSGDAGAFGRWLAGAEEPLRAALRPFAASVDTEAVLQEAALRVWQLAPRFVPDGRANSLLRWAIRVTKNLAVSERRRLRVTPVPEDALELALHEEQPAVAPSLPDPHLRKAIVGCREKLPAQPARALAARLAAGGGEPDEVLAERLSMRLNTFLQNVTRARSLLAKCLEALGIHLETELT
jgi:RNA polymerase sigma-70 factor (ECF subfamily)